MWFIFVAKNEGFEYSICRLEWSYADSPLGEGTGLGIGVGKYSSCKYTRKKAKQLSKWPLNCTFTDYAYMLTSLIHTTAQSWVSYGAASVFRYYAPQSNK